MKVIFIAGNREKSKDLFLSLTKKHHQDLLARPRENYMNWSKQLKLKKYVGCNRSKSWVSVWHLQRPSSCFHCVNSAKSGEISSLALFLQVRLTSDVPPSSIMSFLCKPHLQLGAQNDTVFSLLFLLNMIFQLSESPSGLHLQTGYKVQVYKKTKQV